MLRQFISNIINEANEEYDKARSDEINELFTKLLKKFPRYFSRGALLDITTSLYHVFDSQFIYKMHNNPQFLSMAITSTLIRNTPNIVIINTLPFKKFIYDSYKDHDILIRPRYKTLMYIDKAKLESIINIAQTDEQLLILLDRVAKQV